VAVPRIHVGMSSAGRWRVRQQSPLSLHAILHYTMALRSRASVAGAGAAPRARTQIPVEVEAVAVLEAGRWA
jgi:hypothetical protein